MFQAKLPNYFWGEAILHATHLINKLPTPVLNWKSPHEMLFDSKPDLSHLKVFGCLAFAKNVSPHKQKLDPRATKCIYLGLSNHKKGFKVFDLQTKQLFSSRDVVFYEDVYPFSTSTISSLPLPSTSPQPSLPSACSAPPISNQIPQSRPARVPQPSLWLKDFVHTSLPMCGNGAGAYTVSTIEPTSFHQANRSHTWRCAMKEELDALHKNQTWDIVVPPPGTKPISCRWVYRIKRNADGTVNKFKARLVARGFLQVYGLDYTDSFAPVAKVVTVRILLTCAVLQKWDVHQVDINNAFLHGQLNEDVYLTPPHGLDVPKNHVCKLQKALYGLKQAPRQWYLEF